MIVRRFIKFDEPLTPDQIKELQELEKMSDKDIIYDDEFPELTDEELTEFKRVNPLPEVRQAAN